MVGAHSFVNKDLPDNVTAFGVPAKIRKAPAASEWKVPYFVRIQITTMYAL